MLTHWIESGQRWWQATRHPKAKPPPPLETAFLELQAGLQGFQAPGTALGRWSRRKKIWPTHLVVGQREASPNHPLPLQHRHWPLQAVACTQHRLTEPAPMRLWWSDAVGMLLEIAPDTQAAPQSWASGFKHVAKQLDWQGAILLQVPGHQADPFESNVLACVQGWSEGVQRRLPIYGLLDTTGVWPANADTANTADPPMATEGSPVFWRHLLCQLARNVKHQIDPVASPTACGRLWAWPATLWHAHQCTETLLEKSSGLSNKRVTPEGIYLARTGQDSPLLRALQAQQQAQTPAHRLRWVQAGGCVLLAAMLGTGAMHQQQLTRLEQALAGQAVPEPASDQAPWLFWLFGTHKDWWRLREQHRAWWQNEALPRLAAAPDSRHWQQAKDQARYERLKRYQMMRQPQHWDPKAVSAWLTHWTPAQSLAPIWVFWHPDWLTPNGLPHETTQIEALQRDLRHHRPSLVASDVTDQRLPQRFSPSVMALFEHGPSASPIPAVPPQYTRSGHLAQERFWAENLPDWLAEQRWVLGRYAQTQTATEWIQEAKTEYLHASLDFWHTWASDWHLRAPGLRRDLSGVLRALSTTPDPLLVWLQELKEHTQAALGTNQAEHNPRWQAFFVPLYGLLDANGQAGPLWQRMHFLLQEAYQESVSLDGAAQTPELWPTGSTLPQLQAESARLPPPLRGMLQQICQTLEQKRRLTMISLP